MDFNEIMALIGSVGFPIVACVYMFILMNKQSENHKAEMNAMTSAINDLKIAINTLVERLK